MKNAVCQRSLYAASINPFLGVATVNGAASTVTLLGAFEWPGNSVGYFIYFENDGYSTSYKVLTRSDTTLVFEDLLSSAPTVVGSNWVLRGTPKGEILNLLNLSINYEVAGPTLHVYTNSGSGEIGT